MKLHPVLPQTKTANDLGAWIADNSIEPRVHEEKVKYTEKELTDWKEKSALISIEIDKLEAVKEEFNHFLKKGTFFNKTTEAYEDQRVLIPGTKGIDALKENREYAGTQITNGFHIVSTNLYGIPYSATKKVHFFDVEGNHWEQYDYKMNPHQEIQYGAPLFDNSLRGANVTMEASGKSVTMSGDEFIGRLEKVGKKSHSERKRGEDPEDDLPFDV